MSALYLGCPLWGQKSWIGNFFPSGTKSSDLLAAYSRRLNTVEGNTTFYALPDLSTVARWRDRTPPGFKFCLKAPQVISHRKRLVGCETETGQFVACLRALGDKRGPAFLQLPPTFSAKHLPLLASYLSAWPRDLPLAVEARHADFFGGAGETDLDETLRRFGVARCNFDTVALFSATVNGDLAVAEAQERKPRFPRRTTRTASFAFTRYVSHPEIDSNAMWLADWARLAAEWLVNGDECYFFFHHPDDTFAPLVARMFHELVATRTPVPALPYSDSSAENAATQSKLF